MGTLCGICKTDKRAFDSLFAMLGEKGGDGGGEREEYKDEGFGMRG